MKNYKIRLIGTVILLGLFLTLSGLGAAPVYAAGPTLESGNASCTDVGEDLYEFKVNFGEEAEYITPEGDTEELYSDVGSIDGEYDVDPSGSIDWGTIAITVTETSDDADNEDLVFDWSSDFGIDYVLVKAGDSVNVYDYTPEAFEDFGLEGPSQQGISHVSFCFDPDLNPSIDIEKATNGEDADDPTGPVVEPGSTVTWTYEVTNTGNVTLTNVTVTDDKLGGITCPESELSPGESMICETTGTAQLGQYDNVGSVTGNPTEGDVEEVSDSDPSHYFGEIAPGIDIEKATNGEDADDPTGPVVEPGSTVTWTYVVENTGNVTLTNVTVLDDKLGGITCPESELSPGESMICETTGTAQLGQYDNVGSVTGNPTLGDVEEVSDSDPSHYFGEIAPGIDIEKATNGEDADDPTGPVVEPGSTVTWTYEVTNTGNVTLTDVTVTDDELTGFSCELGELAPGASTSCETTGVAQHGQYDNVGSVTGNPTQGDVQEVSDEDPSHYFGIIEPGIVIEKATNGEDADDPTGPVVEPGSQVEWTYVVENTGNVTLTNVTVTDDQGVTVSCPTAELAPGAGMTCTATGTAQHGQYGNVGSVTGNPTLGDVQEVSDSDPSHYFGEIAPGIDIEKATNGEDADQETGPVVQAGSTVTWTYVVENTGNVTLTNVTVTDNQEGPVCVIESLAPGAVDSCELTGTAQEGQYGNTGIVTGTPTVDGEGDVNDSDPSHYLGVTSALGDFVWLDTNENGIQDAGEPGVAGVEIELYDSADQLVGTDTTDSNGEYLFTDLSAGTYSIQVVVSSLPAETTFTGQNAGSDDALDSDVDAATGRSESVTLGINATDLTLDVGLVQIEQEPELASLGDFVWFDEPDGNEETGNGLQDGGEQGVEGIGVRLYSGNFEGAPILTTVTDADGKYLFTELAPGAYCLEFEIPEEFTASPAKVGDDESVDSDGETVVNATTIRTGCFELAAGQVDLSRDLGIYEETTPTGEEESEQPENGGQRMYLPSLQRSQQAGSAGAAVPAGESAEPEVVEVNSVENTVEAEDAQEQVYLPSLPTDEK